VGPDLVKSWSSWTLATQATHMSSITITTFDQFGNQRAPGGDVLLTSVTLLAQGGDTPTGQDVLPRLQQEDIIDAETASPPLLTSFLLVQHLRIFFFCGTSEPRR
jgi:hypothetical protein